MIQKLTGSDAKAGEGGWLQIEAFDSDVEYWLSNAETEVRILILIPDVCTVSVRANSGH